MGWLANQLLNYSIRDLQLLVRKLHMVPITLRAPAALSSIDALLSLFPDLDRQTAEAYQLEYFSDMEFHASINAKVVSSNEGAGRPPAQVKRFFTRFSGIGNLRLCSKLAFLTGKQALPCCKRSTTTTGCIGLNRPTRRGTNQELHRAPA